MFGFVNIYRRIKSDYKLRDSPAYCTLFRRNSGSEILDGVLVSALSYTIRLLKLLHHLLPGP